MNWSAIEELVRVAIPASHDTAIDLLERINEYVALRALFRKVSDQLEASSKALNQLQRVQHLHGERHPDILIMTALRTLESVVPTLEHDKAQLEMALTRLFKVGLERLNELFGPKENVTCTVKYRQSKPLWSSERSVVTEAIMPLLETSTLEIRFAVEWYVHRCIDAGFCKTPDQMRLCAERYLAGKRAVTPPGTKRRKTAEKKKKKILANVPPEMLEAVDAAIAANERAITQFKGGLEKALNAVIGAVMKRHKADPAIVREVLLRRIG